MALAIIVLWLNFLLFFVVPASVWGVDKKHFLTTKENLKMVWKGKKVGLALGGGGARGLAHIGALEVFEKESIPIDILVGTSIGALVGAAYASGINPKDLKKTVSEYLNSSEFQSSALKAIEQTYIREKITITQKIQGYFKDRLFLIQAFFRPGIFPYSEMQKLIDYFLPDIDIKETKIPFRSVATDLVSGQQITFSEGSLRQAVLASCSVPGAIEPLKEGEKLLSDGGIICLVPASVARREGADMVIAVSVDRDIYSEEDFNTAVSVYQRANEIMSHKLEIYELQEADIVITPTVGNLHWSEFSQADSLIYEGEKATIEKLDLIRQFLYGPKWWSNIKQFFGQSS